MSLNYSQNGEQLELIGPGANVPLIIFTVAGQNPCAIYSGSGNPNGIITASTPSIYLDVGDASIWFKTSFSGSSGWILVAPLIGPIHLTQGYGSTSPTVNHLLLGAGGPNPDSVSISWGDGAGNKLNFINNAGVITATFFDNSGLSIDKIGILTSPTASFPLDVAGGLRAQDVTITGVTTALRPAKLDSTKKVISGLIDLGSVNDVAGTGLSASQVLKWDGTKVTGITGLGSGVVSELVSPAFFTAITSVSLSGTVPPGLTLSTTAETQALKCNSLNNHIVTTGVVTT